MKNTIVFALSSSVGLAEDICKELGLELGKCEVKHFADGEILVELGESVRGKHVYFVQSTNKPVNSNLMEILIGIDACKRASAASITAIIPYFGYARQDRKAKPRQPITSKLVASMLETAGADRVVTVDLHATQIQGFFDIPADDITANGLIADYFKHKEGLGEIVVVSPDHGGAVRARNLANALGAPIAIIDKRRPKPNVAEAMNLIGDVDGSGPAIERLKAAELAGFVCTNTIDQTENQKNYPEMTVLSMAPLLAGLIHAVEENSSLSEVLAHAFDD